MALCYGGLVSRRWAALLHATKFQCSRLRRRTRRLTGVRRSIEALYGRVTGCDAVCYGVLGGGLDFGEKLLRVPRKSQRLPHRAAALPLRGVSSDIY